MKLNITNKLRYNPYLYKNIFKLLSLSLFISNFSIYPSIANSNKEIDNRYEEFEGEYITVDDYVDSEIKDIEILGNTTQNEDDLSDIKSVGDKVDGLDLYKIPILSVGKNLFDINDFTYNNFIKLQDNKIILTGLTSGISSVRKNIKLKPDTKYTITIKAEGNQGAVLRGSINKDATWHNDLISMSYDKTKETFTTPSDGIVNIGFVCDANKTTTIWDIQLEEGTVATPYEPYQEDKLTILSPTPLERVGDVADRIICKDGVWGVEKNIGEIVLNGSEDWRTNATATATNQMYLDLPDAKAGLPNSVEVLSDKLQGLGSLDSWTTEVDCIAIFDGYSRVRIKKVGMNDLVTFKAWLQANNVLVKYQLAQPQFIPLPNSQQLKLRTFVNKTHIFSQTENGVNPTIKIKIDRVIRLASIAVNQAENEPTIENLTIARNLVNQMSESELKNEFQQRLNNLSINYGLPVEDIVSTSNVDVYIKYENMISMALSTNSVSFEDCSLVADTEKNNAISISINSSLPYQLNSYLVTEIQNNDKSSTLDINVLSIKDSSEVNYKNFPDINEKLILKDDCDSGNDKRHNIDLKVKANDGYKADIYKTVIKFEARQK